MKTVSILQYDHEDHQFSPSFVIQDDLEDTDDECLYDELILQPSEEWMEDYLQWNRFGRLPDDPAEDLSEEDDPSSLLPTFESLEELHLFNAKGEDLTQRLQKELASSSCVQVAPFKPIYSNIVVGPVSSWWHVKDRNYDLIVPVQRLPVCDQIKSRLQAFRCHKGMEFWKLADTLQQLQQEGRELQKDLLLDLHHTVGESSNKEEQSPPAEAAATVEESMASNLWPCHGGTPILYGRSCSRQMVTSCTSHVRIRSQKGV